MELRNHPKINASGTRMLKKRSTSSRSLVLIADRNPVLAEVLASHLTNQPSLECRYVDQAADLVAAVTEFAPDVLIVDPAHLELTAKNDLSDFSRNMRIAHADALLVGYSFTVNLSMLRAVMDAGFRGCVSKNATLHQLEIAIEAVLDEGVYFDKGFGSQLRPMLADRPSEEILSEREKEIVISFARGLSAKQIAYDLKISSKTVDTYKARASQKLGLSDRSKLVDYVLEQGWLG